MSARTWMAAAMRLCMYRARTGSLLEETLIDFRSANNFLANNKTMNKLIGITIIIVAMLALVYITDRRCRTFIYNLVQQVWEFVLRNTTELMILTALVTACLIGMSASIKFKPGIETTITNTVETVIERPIYVVAATNEYVIATVSLDDKGV